MAKLRKIMIFSNTFGFVRLYFGCLWTCFISPEVR